MNWVTLEKLDGLTIHAADSETLLAMKIVAERDKDTRDHYLIVVDDALDAEATLLPEKGH
ncbi:hypothetical protein AS189_13030 [Arthrobacter alpinus]|uniref:Uncharacterized protein n=1 Tax=Arthrobacter alpinus TaxID=656366 RepID=A0A0S2M1H4_9MICC|nr:hypothetical protein [Arthrobacter alpinus]ALO67255.1 hypothetical protein AS189_13030 [Arthrobacter alpinus]